MSHSVVVLANTVIDISFQVESFPILPDRHQTIMDRVITPGGPANTLLCGARLGLSMVSLSNVGDDDLGRLWVNRVAAEGVDVSQVLLRDDRPTSVTVALAAPDGRHVFLVYNSSFNSGPTTFPEGWTRRIRQADALFMDGWSFRSMGPDVNHAALDIARAAAVPVFFDPGPEIPYMTPAWIEEMFGGATVAMLTQQEAEKVSGERLEPKRLAERIQQMGPELVLLKLGADGMIAHTREETVSHPGFSVPVRDLTGAGDSVTAAAILAYLEGYPLEKLVILANATGAAAVQKLGAGVNVPNRQEVQAVLHQAGVVFDF